MKTYIHVNQHILQNNKRTGARNPAIIVKTYKGTVNAHDVIVRGEITFKYRPDDPLDCGAHVWAETEGEVEIVR
jgi:hypothetical protein